MTIVPLASDPGMGHHHTILGMIGGYGGQIKREREREDKNVTSSAARLLAVSLIQVDYGVT